MRSRAESTAKAPRPPDSHFGKGQEFRRHLLAWYDAKGRDLPWRKNRDPYRVWLSEVMLQQTRVAAVLERYEEFVGRFPSVAGLASAREQTVLSAWSGLGYYRRARMLHAAAKRIVKEYPGGFPSTASAWERLPGVGRYTAAAVASIAFGEAVAVVDGNVERVLRRGTGRVLNQAETWAWAQEMVSRTRPGDFNQAMMELGAMVCLPRQPKCDACPVSRHCASKGEIQEKKPKQRRIKAAISLVFSCRDAAVFLRRRPQDASLMPGMWELPEVRDKKPEYGFRFSLQHSITKTDYTVSVWEQAEPGRAEGAWIAERRLERMALSGLTRKILRRLGLLSRRKAHGIEAGAA